MSKDRKETPLGGFFELELPLGEHYIHKDAIALSTGRSCLCAILNYLRPKRCLLPFYSCDAVVDPFRKFGVDVEFYEITDTMAPARYPELGPDDCLLYVNYFGLKRDEAERLLPLYGARLIIDDTHDFFFEGGYRNAWSFTSARKYFGVPDGAYLSIPQGVKAADVVPEETPVFVDISLQHGLKRLLGRQQEAFELFQEYEARLPCELYRISKYSRCILSHIDFAQARTTRRKNFETLAKALDGMNCLNATLPDQAIPFAYPFLPAHAIERKRFFERKIYIPTLWPELLQTDVSGFLVSRRLAKDLLPLPVDHRYGTSDMMRVISATNEIVRDSR